MSGKFVLLFLALAGSLFPVVQSQTIDEYMNKMTLKQKIGQMIQLTTETVMASPQSANYDIGKLAGFFSEYGIGSLYNTPFMTERSGKFGWSCEEWIKFVDEAQKRVMQLGAPPLLIGLDSLHGTNYILGSTLFPHNIGLAATFSPELVELAGMITGKDSRTCGISWNFGPAADIALQPLWARHYETFGSDPYVNAVMVRSVIRGYQRPDLSSPGYDYASNASQRGEQVFQTVTTTKHWVGYSNPDSGADRTDATVPDWMLKRYYVPAFSAAVTEGTSVVMLNSGTMNKVPGHADRQSVEVLLRQTLNFQGMTLSDYEDVQNLFQKHKIVPTLVEAVQTAFSSGLDMAMAPFDLRIAQTLFQLVSSGRIPQSLIDMSVRRILKTKKEAGLFERPYGFPQNAATVGSAADRAVSQRCVEESVTLLKNSNNALPFSNATKRTILVTGAWASSLTLQSGGWTWQWQGSLQEASFRGRGTTILQGLQNKATNMGWSVQFHQAIGPTGRLDGYQDAISAASTADCTVVVLGERPYAEMLNNIQDLALPDSYGAFVAALKQSAGSEPVILVMIQGRQRTSAQAFSSADAILYGYLPGPEAGAGIARVLFGDVNPSGRLPFDYIGQTGQRHLQVGSFAHTPLWDFGHGLSYTIFTLGNLTTSVGNGTFVLNQAQSQFLDVYVTITNTGARQGKEVVFLFLSEFAGPSPQTQQLPMLKRFTKVELAPSQRRQLRFRLNGSDFRYSIPQNGAEIALALIARIGSDIKSSQEATIRFSSTLPSTAWPESLAENMPENISRPTGFLAPESAPPVADTPFAPVPIAPPKAAAPQASSAPVPSASAPFDPWYIEPISFGNDNPLSSRAPMNDGAQPQTSPADRLSAMIALAAFFLLMGLFVSLRMLNFL